MASLTDAAVTRQCSKCTTQKDASAFSNKQWKLGKARKCKACVEGRCDDSRASVHAAGSGAMIGDGDGGQCKRGEAPREAAAAASAAGKVAEDPAAASATLKDAHFKRLSDVIGREDCLGSMLVVGIGSEEDEEVQGFAYSVGSSL